MVKTADINNTRSKGRTMWKHRETRKIANAHGRVAILEKTRKNSLGSYNAC